VKSVTLKVTDAVWTRLPLVPVIVSVELAAGVVPVVVVTVMVVEPEPVTVVGLNVAPAPAGSPLTVKETAALNPPDLVTVTV